MPTSLEASIHPTTLGNPETETGGVTQLVGYYAQSPGFDSQHFMKPHDPNTWESTGSSIGVQVQLQLLARGHPAQ